MYALHPPAPAEIPVLTFSTAEGSDDLIPTDDSDAAMLVKAMILSLGLLFTVTIRATELYRSHKSRLTLLYTGKGRNKGHIAIREPETRALTSFIGYTTDTADPNTWDDTITVRSTMASKVYATDSDRTASQSHVAPVSTDIIQVSQTLATECNDQCSNNLRPISSVQNTVTATSPTQLYSSGSSLFTHPDLSTRTTSSTQPFFTNFVSSTSPQSTLSHSRTTSYPFTQPISLESTDAAPAYSSTQISHPLTTSSSTPGPVSTQFHHISHFSSTQGHSSLQTLPFTQSSPPQHLSSYPLTTSLIANSVSPYSKTTDSHAGVSTLQFDTPSPFWSLTDVLSSIHTSTSWSASLVDTFVPESTTSDNVKTRLSKGGSTPSRYSSRITVDETTKPWSSAASRPDPFGPLISQPSTLLSIITAGVPESASALASTRTTVESLSDLLTIAKTPISVTSDPFISYMTVSSDGDSASAAYDPAAQRTTTEPPPHTALATGINSHPLVAIISSLTAENRVLQGKISSGRPRSPKTSQLIVTTDTDISELHQTTQRAATQLHSDTMRHNNSLSGGSTFSTARRPGPGTTSRLYDASHVSSLTATTVDLIASTTNQDSIGSSTSNSNASTTTNRHQSPKQRATAAGIAVGAVGLGAVFGAVMFTIARRYRQRKMKQSRNSLDADAQESLDHRCIGVPDRNTMNRPSLRGPLADQSSDQRRRTVGRGGKIQFAGISRPIPLSNSLHWT